MPVLVLPAVGVLAALLVLLIILGAAHLAKFVAHIIPGDIPVVGSWLRDNVEKLANIAIASIGALFQDAARPVAKLISYPISFLSGMFDIITHTLADLSAVANVTVHSTIPRFYNLARDYAHTLAVSVRVYAAALVAAAERRLGALIDVARAYAHSLAVSVRAYATLIVAALEHRLIVLINSARSYAHALAVSVEHYAAALVASAEHRLSQAIAGVDHYARAAFAAAETFTMSKFAEAEHYAVNVAKVAAAESVAALDASIYDGLVDVWKAVGTEVSTLEGELATDFPDILAGVRAIPRAIPRDAATAIAGAAAISIPMLRYMRTCGTPNCRNLGGFGRELQALLGMVEDAAFIALIAELISNPAGAAHEIESVLGGLATETIHEAKTLFGVG